MAENFRPFVFSLLLMLTFGQMAVHGQEVLVKIDPIKETPVRVWKSDLYVYGMGGSQESANLWTATSGIEKGGDKYKYYNTCADFGVTTNFYNNKILRYSASLGYMYSRYAINHGLHLNGLCSNWMSMDLNVGASFGGGIYYYVGLKGNVFISGSRSATNDFKYPGLNIDCFNKFSCNWYIGADSYYKIFKFNLRFGSYIKPQLNANKIYYYNMCNTYVGGGFFEVGVSIRIFSTSSKYVSLEI